MKSNLKLTSLLLGTCVLAGPTASAMDPRDHGGDDKVRLSAGTLVHNQKYFKKLHDTAALAASKARTNSENFEKFIKKSLIDFDEIRRCEPPNKCELVERAASQFVEVAERAEREAISYRERAESAAIEANNAFYAQQYVAVSTVALIAEVRDFLNKTAKYVADIRTNKDIFSRMFREYIEDEVKAKAKAEAEAKAAEAIAEDTKAAEAIAEYTKADEAMVAKFLSNLRARRLKDMIRNEFNTLRKPYRSSYSSEEFPIVYDDGNISVTSAQNPGTVERLGPIADMVFSDAINMIVTLGETGMDLPIYWSSNLSLHNIAPSIPEYSLPQKRRRITGFCYRYGVPFYARSNNSCRGFRITFEKSGGRGEKEIMLYHYTWLSSALCTDRVADFYKFVEEFASLPSLDSSHKLNVLVHSNRRASYTGMFIAFLKVFRDGRSDITTEEGAIEYAGEIFSDLQRKCRDFEFHDGDFDMFYSFCKMLFKHFNLKQNPWTFKSTENAAVQSYIEKRTN